MLPALELEWAIGDDVGRLGPLVAVLLDRLLVDGEERVVRDLLDEPGLRRGELHLERLRVESFDADLVASASQFDSHELYSSAPTIPKNW